MRETDEAVVRRYLLAAARACEARDLEAVCAFERIIRALRKEAEGGDRRDV